MVALVARTQDAWTKKLCDCVLGFLDQARSSTVSEATRHFGQGRTSCADQTGRIGLAGFGRLLTTGPSSQSSQRAKVRARIEKDG